MGGFAGLFAVLLTIFAIAFAVALGVLFLGVIVRVLGVLFRAIFGAIAIVLGAAADLVVATFALLPLLIHAGVALALVVFGQWPGAERRAAKINDGFVGIGRRITRALWGRPVRILAWIPGGRSERPASASIAVGVGRNGGSPVASPVAVAPPAPPPPPPFMRPPPVSPAFSGEGVPQEERTMAMLAHLLAFVGFAFPLGNIVGPLVLWLAKKDRMPYLDEQGRESVNFNITVAILTGVGMLLTPILVGFAILPVVLLTWVVLTIVAAVKAHAGEPWRYPICLRFIGAPSKAASPRAASMPNASPVATPAVSVAAARNSFPGYEIVGSLAAGGSGARLLIAKPSAEIRRRLPEGLDRVVIKTFALSEGSTLPQIVRESRSMEAATRLGLVVEHRLEPGRFWYAMPYFPGSHFNEAVRSLHRLGPDDGLDANGLRRVLEWTAGLAATLDRYHRAGLWHKDVKPENVLVAGGECRLVDIGLVTSLSSGMTLTTHGTEYFRDPEMVRLALRGVKVHEVDGAKFDLYGVGAMLYLGLEDTFPAHGGLSGFSKKSPECVRWVVRRAMADYAKRYPDAATMRADLEAILAAKDPWSLKPAMLPSFRGEAAEAAKAVPADDAVGSAVEELEVPAGVQRGPARALPALVQLAIDEVESSAIGGGRGTPAPRRRRSGWGLTSPGIKRGAGRTLAALVLFAIGLIVALVFAASVDRNLDRSTRSIVVVDAEGDLSPLFRGERTPDSLAALVESAPGLVTLVEAPPRLIGRLQGASQTLSSDPARAIRESLRGREGRALEGIDGVIYFDRDRQRIVSVYASRGVDASWFGGAIELFTESGRTWTSEITPIQSILPASPGSRVLLLRDPTATASLSNADLELWRRLGLELVEPSAEDAAELAIWLAGDRTGPQVQAQVREALDRYGAAELCRIREPRPISSLAEDPAALAADPGEVVLSKPESMKHEWRRSIRNAIRGTLNWSPQGVMSAGGA